MSSGIDHWRSIIFKTRQGGAAVSYQSPFWRQHVYTLAIVGFVVFVALTIIAMLCYPGGTVTDVTTSGYSFFENFFSDLGFTVSRAGQPNTVSALLFTTALTMAGLGLAFFFVAFRQFFTGSSKERWLSGTGSVFGVFTGICFVGVAFTPVNLFKDIHLDFVFGAFRAFPVAAICYAAAIFLGRSYPRRYGLVFAAFSVLLVLYLLLIEIGPDADTLEGMIIQATGQKIIAYASIITILLQAIGAKRLASPQDSGRDRRGNFRSSPRDPCPEPALGRGASSGRCVRNGPSGPPAELADRR